MKVNGMEGPQRAQRKKGVVTFNRPAPTGQGTDREVRGGQEWSKEDIGGADPHKGPLSAVIRLVTL